MDSKINIMPEQIKSIAEDIDTGFIVYFHKQTGDIKSFPDFEDSLGGEYEDDPEREEVEDNIDDYMVFTKMDASEYFRMMSDFVNTVKEQALVRKLDDALNRKKPFRNFKNIIDNSLYRQKWFDFKDQYMYEYVKDQIDQENRSGFVKHEDDVNE